MTSGDRANRAFDQAARLAAAALGVACAIVVYRAALAAPSKSPVGPTMFDARSPTTTLAVPPRLLRVRIDVSPGAATITHDLSFQKDDLRTTPPHGEPLIYLAFTAQDRPIAVEIGELSLDDAGVPIEGVPRPVSFADVNARPAAAALVIGSSKSAGHVARLPKVVAPFALRVRSAIAVPTGLREVSLMARLGVREGKPIPISRIEIAGTLGTTIRGARAVLCGPHADTRPIRVEFPGYPSTPDAADVIEPEAATRHEDDDLCVSVLI